MSILQRNEISLSSVLCMYVYIYIYIYICFMKDVHLLFETEVTT
jgi:hypothetical protein